MARLALLLRKAIQNLAVEFWLNVVTVLVIAVALTLVGAFLLLAANASTLLDQFAGHVEVMIFLKDDHTPQQVQALTEKLWADPAVEATEYVSKTQALERFSKELEELGDLAASMDENPLPASIDVQLLAEYRDTPDIEAFSQKWINEPIVEEVYFGKEWVERLTRFVRMLWIIGSAVGVFLAATAVFIISTTLRLTIHRRKSEIEILRLVGATRRFIQMPFIFEGIFQGLAGAAGALALLYTVFWAASKGLATGAPGFLGPLFPGFSLQFLSGHHLILLIASGALLGFFGSLLSVGRFLKE